MKSPQDYSERILLLVTGLSPQVVTETLYALTQVRQPPFLPTRVVVITTGDGARRLRLELLSRDRDWFGRLRREYGLPAIQFEEKDIHIIQDEVGKVLADIRTPEQNGLVADQIAETVRELASNPDSAIHASIAGGRKTMGFYLGYAMSLYGRPQDRLSHVLVDEGYEGNKDFFYPTRESMTIHDREGNPLDASRARVMQADIPFVRLRDGLPGQLLEGRSRFSDTVEIAQKLYGPPSLEIDLSRKHVRCAGVPVRMTNAELAFFLFMAERARKQEEPVRWDEPAWKEQYLAAYRRLVPEMSADLEQAENALANNDQDDDKKYFEQRKTRTNKALESQLGKRGAQTYRIQRVGSRGKSRYAIQVSPKVITIQ